MQNNYKAPHADQHEIYTEIMEQTHIMIGGSTGSGKSTIEAGIIYNLVNTYTPDELELWLVDPKKMELVKYESLPHVRYYVDNDNDTKILMAMLISEMDRRNTIVQAEIRAGKNAAGMWTGKQIYCFIDETADVIARNGKDVLRQFQILLQMARTAGIHMVFCSQSFDAKMIPSHTAGNITCTVGLYVVKNKQHIARTITGNNDCCKLPPYGKCVLVTPRDYGVRDVPMYSPLQHQLMKEYWLKENAKANGLR